MIYNIIVGVSTTFVLIVSIYLVAFVILYLKTKPIGMQTLLDLTYQDTSVISILVTLILHTIIWTSLFKENIDDWYKITLVISLWLACQLLITSMLVTIIIKSILILNQTWLSDVPDEKAITWTREVILILTSFACLLDLNTYSKSNHIMDIISNNDDCER